MGKILQVFLGADLRNGHEGLALTAKQEKIDVAALAPGEFVIFINTKQDKLKLYTASNIVAYLKLPEGKIDLRVIQMIPKAFKASGKIDYDKHLKEIIEQNLRGKR